VCFSRWAAARKRRLAIIMSRSGIALGLIWQINTNVFIAQWRISNVDIN
jgi:hypothetical protein